MCFTDLGPMACNTDHFGLYWNYRPRENRSVARSPKFEICRMVSARGGRRRGAGCHHYSEALCSGMTLWEAGQDISTGTLVRITLASGAVARLRRPTDLLRALSSTDLPTEQLSPAVQTMTGEESSDQVRGWAWCLWRAWWRWCI